MSRLPLPVLLAAALLVATPLVSHAQSVSVFRPMSSITHILGSAQMDQDGPEEIAILFGEDRLMIIDSYSGAVEFDSDGYG